MTTADSPETNPSATVPTPDLKTNDQKKPPLNLILQGPPGTGKTYATIEWALRMLELADPDVKAPISAEEKWALYAAEVTRRKAAEARYAAQRDKKEESVRNAEKWAKAAEKWTGKAKKRRFDALVAEGRVRFVTFHQSFSYEDFVEGLRAKSAQTGNGISYEVVPGVFKQLCNAAAGPLTPTQYRTLLEKAVNLVVNKFVSDAAKTPQLVYGISGAVYEVTYDREKNGKTLLVKILNKTNKRSSESQEEVPTEKNSSPNKFYPNIEQIKNALLGEAINTSNDTYVKAIVARLKPQLEELGVDPSMKLPYVLIIDEINRGNVSRIFGELITLIEPSKRKGQPEALKTILPYSGEKFSVPDNVYIIGTMNTADRSLTGLDLALRRRFTFEEMPPRPELLAGVTVEGVSLKDLLSVINERIEVLLDRDHLIGHAYFMPLTEPGANTVARLAEVFRGQVIPLLQEYFFDDWERIRWVLNDPAKAPDFQFVIKGGRAVAELFGEDARTQIKDRRWRLNEKAFANIESYRGVRSEGN